MRTFLSVYLPAICFVVTCIVLYAWHTPIDLFRTFIAGHDAVSYFVFVALLTLSTVFLPVTIMPIIPVSAVIFGPFVTGVLSVIGWTIGAVIAFLIARYLGRPAVARFVSLERIDAYAAKMPQDAQFFIIVLLRLVLPVDIMSYVIGLSSTISLWRYTLATLVGVTWFSFAFAYLGNAFHDRNIFVLVAFGTLSLAIFMLGWYTLWRHHKKSEE